MPIKFAGLFADQPVDDTVPRLEPGSNPQGEWVQQRKLFALAAGDGRLPVWFDALSGGTGDSPTYVPQCEAFCQHAQLAPWLPLQEVIVIGDRKMPTVDNPLAWLRLGVSSMGPTTMQDSHRQALRTLLDEGQSWTALPYVAGRETDTDQDDRTVYRGVGHPCGAERCGHWRCVSCAASLHLFQCVGPARGAAPSGRDGSHRGGNPTDARFGQQVR